jgi:hypothetical protein
VRIALLVLEVGADSLIGSLQHWAERCSGSRARWKDVRSLEVQLPRYVEQLHGVHSIGTW